MQAREKMNTIARKRRQRREQREFASVLRNASPAMEHELLAVAMRQHLL